ncbi:hypothetical protein BDW42DRAFT_13773 [Aspergillus taichungensis]|uniref:Uncharacterized protein n=1 Tax=Aspergillus taichungensis TaxID=482145 RepID=A0A2J5HIW1_9EURO|nr:hypothetical protein BDW42DRAFT_13773 [Aspergillus taichungensis]
MIKITMITKITTGWTVTEPYQSFLYFSLSLFFFFFLIFFDSNFLPQSSACTLFLNGTDVPHPHIPASSLELPFSSHLHLISSSSHLPSSFRLLSPSSFRLTLYRVIYHSSIPPVFSRCRSILSIDL